MSTIIRCILTIDVGRSEIDGDIMKVHCVSPVSWRNVSGRERPQGCWTDLPIIAGYTDCARGLFLFIYLTSSSTFIIQTDNIGYYIHTIPSKNFFAIIAGVGPGTGRSVAIRFSKAYPVVLLSRHQESYQDVVAEVNNAGGKAIGVSIDAADPSSLASDSRLSPMHSPA